MNSDLQHALQRLARREDLDAGEARRAFAILMRGDATAAQTAALLMGLRAKGETAAEVAGAAGALRDAMVRVAQPREPAIDTCGTGGGTVTTFNISTAASFVAAGAGAVVAKHGNRSYTSQCGSADVLEAVGVGLLDSAERAAAVLARAGIVFLFAPHFHPAMRFAAPIRRELGVPTIMNLLGPLANPAGVTRQVVGVADRDRAALLADALARLGTEHALVVHGRVGMDEIAPSGPSDIWEVRGDAVTQWLLEPARWGLEQPDPTTLRGGSPVENARWLREVLAQRPGTRGTEAVALNAAAAIYVAGVAESFDEGLECARTALREGAALSALERLRAATNEVSTSE